MTDIIKSALGYTFMILSLNVAVVALILGAGGLN